MLEFAATSPLVNVDRYRLSIESAVNATFQTRNPIPGNTDYDSAASGAMLQSGADTLAGQDFDAFYYYAYNLVINVPSPSAGLAGVGRSRMTLSYYDKFSRK